MAYSQGLEVIMHPIQVSGAAATTVGGDTALSATVAVARWAPGYFTHKVHAASIVISNMPAALTANTPISFWHYRPFTGTDSATVVAQINLPTTLSLASGPVGVIKRVTSNVFVRPGEQIVVQPTTAATQALRGLCVLYVSPSYEQPTTVRTASTASTAGGNVVFVNST